MLGDSIVYLVGAAMLAAIPLCFRVARAADRRTGRAEFTPARAISVLVLGTFTLVGGITAALFGGTWWLSPVGSVAATVIVGAMMCAIAAIASVPVATARRAEVNTPRVEEPLRRAA